METTPVDELSPTDWLFGIQMTVIYDMPSVIYDMPSVIYDMPFPISSGGSLFIVVGYWQWPNLHKRIAMCLSVNAL